tara:strand:+ start:102 stop:218 length:117 start_codon:yes stop_codon:yes gene_type:complete
MQFNHTPRELGGVDIAVFRLNAEASQWLFRALGAHQSL